MLTLADLPFITSMRWAGLLSSSARRVLSVTEGWARPNRRCRSPPPPSRTPARAAPLTLDFDPAQFDLQIARRRRRNGLGGEQEGKDEYAGSHHESSIRRQATAGATR